MPRSFHFEISEADLSRQLERRDRVRLKLKFEPLDVRAPDVLGSGKRLTRSIQFLRGDHHVAVPAEIDRRVGAQRVIEPFALLTDLERGGFFGFERGELQIVERPRIEAASPESRRDRCVGHEIAGPLIVDARLPVDMRVIRSGLAIPQIQHRARN
jgi:hypothetical protein